MCQFTGNCEAGEEAHWEKTTEIGGTTIETFGCRACGFSDAL